LDFEIVAFHFAGLSQKHGLFGYHFLENHFCDTRSSCLSIAHQYDVHDFSYIWFNELDLYQTKEKKNNIRFIDEIISFK
jgi:hypothetical protein